MAVYKNREVGVLSFVSAEDSIVEIVHKDGSREQVNASQVQFTDDEVKDLSKGFGTERLNTIDSKDLQSLRDSQDKEKIEKTQSKNPESVDVPVSQIKVNANEVNKAKR